MRAIEINNLNTSEFWDKLNKRNLFHKIDNPIADHRTNTVISLVSKGNNRILNLGFGSASLEEKLYEYENVDLVGLDISGKSVNIAKRRFKRWNFMKGDVVNLPKSLNNFDDVIMLEVLEHIQPSKTFIVLKSINKLLKEKGRLILSVPINEGLQDMIKRGENPNAHVRLYTHNILKAELNTSGFKIIKTIDLYAFRKNYNIKTLVMHIFGSIIKTIQPNNIICVARKI